ncbi:PHP domain-containing protein [Anaerosporobacter faecicola]|uniref:PHP domain-containing protein n=1 Tax=Anaerosporobacter faecicola TaxID=2718714 RepID=UPI00143BDD02|nr:PHP domain-containing protein [Anaerosporobacter faecicola]
MKYIDLHVHSNSSDGTFTPTQVVDEAIRSGLAAFALTDHDTVQGLQEAREAVATHKEQGQEIELISGVEISSAYKGKDLHILGLFVDDTNPNLINRLAAAVKERDERNLKMIHNLNEAGIPITFEALREDAPDTVITRAHFAKYLTENGYTKTRNDAFTKYLNPDTPYYVPRQFIEPKDAIALILEADGIPVLAHPLLYHLPSEELATLVAQLKSYGLAGIEAVYTNNTGCDESDMRRLARLNGLLLSGGSDFHGGNKPDIAIGKGRGNLKIPYEFVEAMKAYKKNRTETALR